MPEVKTFIVGDRLSATQAGRSRPRSAFVSCRPAPESLFAHVAHRLPLLCFTVLSFFYLAVQPSALAQTERASVSGLITDPSGGVVVDAEVEITNVDTGASTTVKTNGAGLYNAPSLLPGRYTITVRKAGFKRVTVTSLEFHVRDNVVRNVALGVGSVAESVTVTADALNINTTDATVSTVVDRQFVENLPLNGRSFQSLLYMTPGVNLNVGAGTIAGAYGSASQGQFVVNGQRADANYWMVDGVSGNVGMSSGIPGAGVAGAIGATNVLGGTSALVSVDALQEFRIESSSYAPEFGREPGGQISIETRSGTNRFHGTAFDYLRNTVLDATDWFANHNHLPKAAEIQNDFGGVVGGPLNKDKTFFFFSFEGLRVRQPTTFLGTVPDFASRQAAIPAVQPYLNAYPLPQPGAVDVAPGLAPYSASFSNRGSADAYSLRIDHRVANNLNLFARYNHAPSSFDQRGAGGVAANVIAAITGVTKTATAGATWLKSPEVVNDVRFNWSVSGGRDVFVTDNFGGGTSLAGGDLLAPGYSLKNSEFWLYPLFGTNMLEFNGFNAGNFQHQFNVVDTLSVQKGTHSLKFGVDYRRLTPFHVFAYEALIPFFASMSELENGQTAGTAVFHDLPGTFLLRNLGAFAQDTWRVSSRLNLTYGLRWDVEFRPDTTEGPNFTGVTGFSTTDLSNLALAPAGTPPFDTRYGNVAPRIGGAYQIRTSPDWGLTLRGGFGVFYGLANTELASEVLDGGYYPWGAVAVPPDPFPTALPVPPVIPPDIQNGGTLFGFDPHLNVPYALEWNVALEQSLGAPQTFKLSYIGASNKRVLLSEHITNPNPNYASTSLLGNEGSLSYQALQAQLQRRMTRGLQALLSYSWSHSIDTGSYGRYTNGSLANPNANRGDSDYDLRHVFSAALTYQFPALNHNAITRAITSGWFTDNIVQMRTGPPLDVKDANFGALSRENANVLIYPDVVPGQPFYLSGSQYPGGRALNPAAFTDPPVDPSTGLPLRQGDLGRNRLRVLGLRQWDFTVRREFSLWEHIKLQFRADLFNILNHPNFGPFNNQFQSGNVFFGQSTSMLNQYLGGAAGTGTQNPLYTPGGPRSGELALKVIF
jgi:hypothetical protein